MTEEQKFLKDLSDHIGESEKLATEVFHRSLRSNTTSKENTEGVIEISKSLGYIQTIADHYVKTRKSHK